MGHFEKLIVSPRIHLVLMAGESESVKITYHGIEESKINVMVKGNTLHLYLDHARLKEKQVRVWENEEWHKRDTYRDASVTAYVTYRSLRKLVVRGEQDVDVDAIQARTFKLTAYGDCRLTLAGLHARKFKACLYGQHTLMVRAGAVDIQKFKLFGENTIDVAGIAGEEIASATYGESKLKLNTSGNLRLVTFGESDVRVTGGADVDRFTFGSLAVRN